jgi:hypothetical protein
LRRFLSGAELRSAVADPDLSWYQVFFSPNLAITIAIAIAIAMFFSRSIHRHMDGLLFDCDVTKTLLEITSRGGVEEDDGLRALNPIGWDGVDPVPTAPRPFPSDA